MEVGPIIDEKCIQNSSQKTSMKETILRELGVNRRMILKWVLKEYGVMIETGFDWDKIRSKVRPL
jgi:hypothetical protein